jgi:hypothetical protein
LNTLDRCVMGWRSYETAVGFETNGLDWAYDDKPTFVLTLRDLPRNRDNVQLYSGDLVQLMNERLRPSFGACGLDSPTKFVIRSCRC